MLRSPTAPAPRTVAYVLNEGALKASERAAELYFRLRMGQAEELERPNVSSPALTARLEPLRRAITGSPHAGVYFLISNPRTGADAHRLYEFWAVCRHDAARLFPAAFGTHSTAPRCISGESLPKIRWDARHEMAAIEHQTSDATLALTMVRALKALQACTAGRYAECLALVMDHHLSTEALTAIRAALPVDITWPPHEDWAACPPAHLQAALDAWTAAPRDPSECLIATVPPAPRARRRTRTPATSARG